MAETDIFNPTDWQAQGFPFNPNPSYGFERRMGANKQIQRPRLGLYQERETMNGGHVFTLNWINTDISVAQRLIEFYHSFKGGYFTLIDQDWFGRQYVGRFMGEPNIIHTANAKYSCQGLLFEEMPLARMLVYPSLAQFGHSLNVVDDYLNPLVALMAGTWSIQVSPLATATFATAPTLATPAALEAIDAVATVGDWAQTAYVGFGFQIVFRLASTLGTVLISLDGGAVVNGLDLSNGTAISTTGATLVVTASAGAVSALVTVTVANVPLNMHFVSVTATGPSAGSTASGASSWSIIFPQLTYAY